MNPIPRRQFLHATALGAAGLCLTQPGCVSTRPGAARKCVAFNTANLVGRLSRT